MATQSFFPGPGWTKPTSATGLPVELLHMIFSKCAPGDLATVMRCCQIFNDVAPEHLYKVIKWTSQPTGRACPPFDQLLYNLLRNRRYAEMVRVFYFKRYDGIMQYMTKRRPAFGREYMELARQFINVNGLADKTSVSMRSWMNRLTRNDVACVVSLILAQLSGLRTLSLYTGPGLTSDVFTSMLSAVFWRVFCRTPRATMSGFEKLTSFEWQDSIRSDHSRRVIILPILGACNLKHAFIAHNTKWQDVQKDVQAFWLPSTTNLTALTLLNPLVSDADIMKILTRTPRLRVFSWTSQRLGTQPFHGYKLREALLSCRHTLIELSLRLSCTSFCAPGVEPVQTPLGRLLDFTALCSIAVPIDVLLVLVRGPGDTKRVLPSTFPKTLLALTLFPPLFRRLTTAIDQPCELLRPLVQRLESMYHQCTPRLALVDIFLSRPHDVARRNTESGTVLWGTYGRVMCFQLVYRRTGRNY